MKHISEKSQNGSPAQGTKLSTEAESESPKISVSQQKVNAMLGGYEELLTCTV